MTIIQAAQVLGISPSTVRKYVSEGRIETAKYGKVHRISPENLKRFFLTDWARGEDWKTFLLVRADKIGIEQVAPFLNL